MKCTSCGAIISTRITTCDFCGIAVKQTVEETIVEVFEELHTQNDIDFVDCNSIAMFESLDTLTDFFSYFDSLAYDPTDEHRYYSASQLTSELHDVIVAQFPEWSESQMMGIFFEDPESIVRKDGLIVTFDADATVVFTYGLGSVKIENNSIYLVGYGRWDNYEDQGVGFWTNSSAGVVNFGHVRNKTYFYGASWDLVEDEAEYAQTVVNANLWVDRIKKIALGEIPADDLVDPKYLDQNDLIDGSRWIGGMDVNGMITGYGRHKWPNGDVYEGKCLAGFRHGEGVYTWRSGEVYEGTWANGVQHGFGINTLVDGTVLEGQWINGVFQG